MNNQTHPILPNSNGTRTEPPKNAGPPARIKRRRRRCASNWKRADPRDRDEFKKKKKKFGQDRKEKRQDPPHAILKIQLEIEPSCFFQMGPDGLFSAGRFISYEGVNYRNGRQKGKGPPVPNDREKMLPLTRRDER